MRTGRTSWFIIAAVCVIASVLIFAGRTILLENLGTPAYNALVISAYVLLGGAAGSLTKAFSIGKNPKE